MNRHITSLRSKIMETIRHLLLLLSLPQTSRMEGLLFQSHHCSGPPLDKSLCCLPHGGLPSWWPPRVRRRLCMTLLLDRTHFENTVHISQLDYAWQTISQLRHPFRNRRIKNQKQSLFSVETHMHHVKIQTLLCAVKQVQIFTTREKPLVSD